MISDLAECLAHSRYSKQKCRSAVQRKEILSRVITWMVLEDIMLSDISQLQKDKQCTIYLYEVARVPKFIETRIKIVVTRD